MHRIDGAGATGDNRFTEGSPQAGVPATVVTADWLNSIQEEIVSVVGANNLDKAKADQLLTAIKRLIDSRAGVGVVGRINLRICDPDNLPTLGPNELVPAGQLLNRADYPELWDYINQSGSVIADSQWQRAGYEAFYSSGNGSTTFRPGNLVTGVFPQFIDLTGLYDPDRNSRTGGNVPGSWLGDAMRRIVGNTGIERGNPSGISGAFYRDDSQTNRYTVGERGGGPTTAFDTSRVVPTASRVRPVSAAILPTINYKKIRGDYERLPRI